MTESLPTLAEALEDEAADLAGAEAAATPDGIEWRRSGVLFAALAGDVVELRLSAAVAAAALRTPGTLTSAKGPGWITFRPAPIDGHALDRAVAWLGSAWRTAGAER